MRLTNKVPLSIEILETIYRGNSERFVGDGDVLRGETKAPFASGQAKKEKRNSRLPRRYLCHEIPRRHARRGCFRLAPCRNTRKSGGFRSGISTPRVFPFLLFRAELFLSARGNPPLREIRDRASIPAKSSTAPESATIEDHFAQVSLEKRHNPRFA